MIKYDWEHADFNASEDKFMQRFDADGNFVNLPVIEENLEEQELASYYVSLFPPDFGIVTNEKNESKPES